MPPTAPPATDRPAGPAGRWLWVFDAIVGVALGLIVAGIVGATRSGTTIVARARLDGAPLLHGFAGLLGIALALVIVLVAALVAAIALRRGRHPDAAGQGTSAAR